MGGESGVCARSFNRITADLYLQAGDQAREIVFIPTVLRTGLVTRHLRQLSYILSSSLTTTRNLECMLTDRSPQRSASTW